MITVTGPFAYELCAHCNAIGIAGLVRGKLVVLLWRVTGKVSGVRP